MVEIAVRANLTLISRQNVPGDGESRKFNISREGIEFEVDVDIVAKNVTSWAKRVTVSEETYKFLQSYPKKSLQDVDQRVSEEINFISKASVDAARAVAAILKYHFGNILIHESLISIKTKEWSHNDKTWKPFPMELSATIDCFSTSPLNDLSVQYVQTQIDTEITPLIGLRHLHRARNEALPHYKWIDATTAAELSIKEILIRAHPMLGPLLLEMPSPPLTKLYGRLLKQYLGEKSPYLKDLGKGIEIRNTLIHRPGTRMIDGQEAIDYVRTIEAAIFHALGLLYPDDKLLQNMNL